MLPEFGSVNVHPTNTPTVPATKGAAAVPTVKFAVKKPVPKTLTTEP
jgi:hypothetical protein